MGKSRKNRDKKNNHSYYDDSDYSNHKKYKKNRFDGKRKDKEVQQRLFVDWDSI